MSARLRFGIGPFAQIALLTLVAAQLFAASGCATLLADSRLNATDRRFSIGTFSGAKPSQAATQTMNARGAADQASSEQLAKLRALVEENPDCDVIYAYMEAAYLEARRLESRRPKEALEIYVSAALYSYHYLFNPALGRRRDRALFNGDVLDAGLLYNGACERALHLAIKEYEESGIFPFRPGWTTSVQCETTDCSFFCQAASSDWTPEEFESFHIAVDCESKDLGFECKRSGLGVPLVVRRRADVLKTRPEEEYYPAELRFPATALLRPNPHFQLGKLPPIDPSEPTPPEGANAPVWVDLYDPTETPDIQINGTDVVLKCDLTTPLAYFLNSKSQFTSKGAAQGLFKPENLSRLIPTNAPTRERTLQGLYMFQPYDPNKIPVVMTHGLGSSPTTWLEMYNALRNSNEIQKEFQFWFYFYPTGQPFWASAAQLRSDLARLRETVDPRHEARALDQMVLIGHSMGGLVSRMQVQTSGDAIWKLVSSKPIDEIGFDPETLQKLRSWFFFEANPSIARVITIATPFRGSDYANNLTQWVADKTISRPTAVSSVAESLTKEQLSRIDDPKLLRTTTSVESLSPDCPIFSALESLPISSDVALNNIVGVLPSLEKRRIMPTRSDGVVDFASAHRGDVESERETPATHVKVHAHPAAIIEVQEILLRHLERARQERGRAPIPRPDLGAPISPGVGVPNELDFNRFGVPRS